MPQPDAERAKPDEGPPDERWSGRCSRAVAAQLLRFDHHTVRREGRLALLLTSHWLESPLVEQPEPLEFFLTFTAAAGQPPASRVIQTLVDGIALTRVTAGPQPG